MKNLWQKKIVINFNGKKKNRRQTRKEIINGLSLKQK